MAAALFLAMLVEGLLGWPPRLNAAIGHPVAWIGALVDRLEARWNHGTPAERRRRGVAATAVVVAVAAVAGAVLSVLLPGGGEGLAVTALVAWPMLATRSLHDHVAAVAAPLEAGDLAGARKAVAAIVGRDPQALDEAGIARAGIESLAENSSDGVIAPLFWGLALGLPGLFAYKAINTLDSMIGHRADRYRDFGRFAAQLDDLANWVPARLTGYLFCLGAPRPGAAIAAMRREAPGHRSPNAGWPEAAVAHALGVRLSGPRRYGDEVADEPWLNPRAPDPAPRDLRRALALYRRTMGLVALALLALALV